MKKKFVLQEIEKAKYFYIDFLVYDSIPLTIKITKKQFKNLVARFKDDDILPVDTMVTSENRDLVLFFIIKINYLP